MVREPSPLYSLAFRFENYAACTVRMKVKIFILEIIMYAKSSLLLAKEKLV